MSKKTITLGAYVRTKRHGHIGRVEGKCHSLSEANGLGNQDRWFAGQIPAIEERHKETPWYSILVHNGGAITTFEEDVEEIEPFEFINPYADFYFKD